MTPAKKVVHVKLCTSDNLFTTLRKLDAFRSNPKLFADVEIDVHSLVEFADYVGPHPSKKKYDMDRDAVEALITLFDDDIAGNKVIDHYRNEILKHTKTLYRRLTTSKPLGKKSQLFDIIGIRVSYTPVFPSAK